MNRHIDIKGGYNIRDLGGYRTKDDLTIRWRKIFRSGLITHIPDKALEKTKDLRLKTICDFRAEDEQSANPDKWYNLDQIKKFSFPIGHGRPDMFDWITDEELTEGDNHHLYKSNRSYVLSYADRYRAFFKVLLDEKNYPILFHCTAGKDRTGFAALLLLTALGVDQNTIIKDYLLTNVYLEEFAEMISKRIALEKKLDPSKVKSIFLARESYIKGALDAIYDHHGSITNFLKNEIKIDEPEIKQLKSILLEKRR